jgi:hypothetical protein
MRFADSGVKEPLFPCPKAPTYSAVSVRHKKIAGTEGIMLEDTQQRVQSGIFLEDENPKMVSHQILHALLFKIPKAAHKQVPLNLDLSLNMFRLSCATRVATIMDLEVYGFFFGRFFLREHF